LLCGDAYHSLPNPDSDKISRRGDAKRVSLLTKEFLGIYFSDFFDELSKV